MWDEKSIYLKIETGYAITSVTNDEIVGTFNCQTFTRGSAILKLLYYNRSEGIFQFLPVWGKVGKTEINRRRNCYNIDTLTSVHIQEIVKIEGKVIEIYEGVFYWENCETFSFGKVIELLFNLRLKNKDEGNAVKGCESVYEEFRCWKCS